LITYGPISFDDIQGKSVSMLNQNSIDVKAPSTVQIVDEWSCTYILALSECKTFIVSLRDCIANLLLTINHTDPSKRDRATLSAKVEYADVRRGDSNEAQPPSHRKLMDILDEI